MEIKLCGVGGYNEVGKNMTALKIGDEAVVLDMGFFLPKLISFEEEGGHRENLTGKGLIRLGAVPDDSVISSWKDKVKAIAATHAHLDHIGAIPYLSNKYDCPILGTPFTAEVLRGMLKDEKLTLKNNLVDLNPNSTFKVSKNIKMEFINMTHSTLQTVMIAVHFDDKVILYANDFKFDNHPILGKKPDYDRLKRIASEKEVLALVVDSLYAAAERKTPSEKVAREMLKDVLLGTDNTGHLIITTCFASHLARIRSILDFAKKLNRKVVFFGRSLSKYTRAAENVKLVNYSKEGRIFSYSRQIKKQLKKIEKKRQDYLIVCTGSQAEPGSILTRLASGALPFKFLPEDHVIFSCKTIPVDINIANRQLLERKLRQKRTRIFTDIHVSGHCGREDLRDLINMVKPKHIIPAHGDTQKLSALSDLAKEMDYKPGKTVHILNDGQVLDLR
jgi:ribonuclease J